MMPELVPHLPVPDETLLLDELNHRINNDFACAIAIIYHAAAHSAADGVKHALREVAQLLQHYAQVHRALQPPDRETLVDAQEYLGNLCRAISRSKLAPLDIELVFAVVPLLLEASRCWRLGMIVSELITNAARHAFAGRPGGIRVELSRGGGFVTCTVADDGSAPLRIQPGRGFRIVEELSKGLDARFERKFGARGSISTLTFAYVDQSMHAAAGRARPAGLANALRDDPMAS
jgi:two-component sensor histidine kinase